MELIASLSVREVNSLTVACVMTGPKAWDKRMNAYWKAYSRRYEKERGDSNINAAKPASECLIALSGAVVSYLDRMQ